MKTLRQAGTLRYPTQGVVLLGKYRVEGLIGEGGMGAVVRAMHLDLEEPVAIKVLLPELAERENVVRRFMQEAKSAVKLKGEHVARVLDVGQLDGFFEGRPHIVMEYLDGADLRAIIKHHGPQHPGAAVDLLLQACEAIAEAHSLGIIHRDIKPSNFFVMRPDYEPLLKVLDFGISTPPQGTTEVTDTDSVIGTPSYMAPEQMRSARDASTQSDIWSLGVVLYECLEGKRPFPQTVYSELCLAVGMDRPQPMVRTPQPLAAVVLRCLEKPLDRRYQSVAELAFELAPFASNAARGQISAETCARMLGRTRAPMRPLFPGGGDPLSGTPPPLTPGSMLPVPDRQSAAAVTPAPVARGQIRAPMRIGIILASAVIACGLVVGGWWYGTQHHHAAAAVADERVTLPAPTPTPAPTPAPTPSPPPPAPAAAPRVEPTVPEPPTPPTVESRPAPAKKPARVVTTKRATPAPTPAPKRPTAQAIKRVTAEDDPFGHR